MASSMLFKFSVLCLLLRFSLLLLSHASKLNLQFASSRDRPGLFVTSSEVSKIYLYVTSGEAGSGDVSGGSGSEGKDGLLWFCDLGKYYGGEFSMAVIKANQVLEDQSQIESGNFGTFVGVYDGHGGPEAASYVCDNLFNHFRGCAATERGSNSPENVTGVSGYGDEFDDEDENVKALF